MPLTYTVSDSGDCETAIAARLEQRYDEFLQSAGQVLVLTQAGRGVETSPDALARSLAALEQSAEHFARAAQALATDEDNLRCLALPTLEAQVKQLREQYAEEKKALSVAESQLASERELRALCVEIERLPNCSELELEICQRRAELESISSQRLEQQEQLAELRATLNALQQSVATMGTVLGIMNEQKHEASAETPNAAFEAPNVGAGSVSSREAYH